MFLVMVLACGAVAVVTARRPAIALTAVVVLAVALPAGAARSMFGTSVQPAMVLTLAVFAVHVARDPRAAGRDIARMVGSVVGVGSFVAAAVICSYFAGRSGELDLVVLQVVTPFVLMLVVRGLRARDVDFARALATNLIVVMLLEAIVVLGTSAGVIPQPWTENTQAQRWWTVDPSRIPGTFEHPLVAALWLTAAVPLTLVFRRAWLRFSTALLLVAAIMPTGSRASLLLAGFSLLVVLVQTRGLLFTKMLFASAVVGTVTVLITGAFGATVTSRFVDDAGSSAIRGKVLELALQIWPETVLVGQGAGASEGVTRNALIGATFENPILIYMVDFGLVATLALFGTLAVLALGAPRAARSQGSRLAALVVLIGVFGFNSFGTSAPVGTLVFFVVALAAVTPRSAETTLVGVAGSGPGAAREESGSPTIVELAR